MNSRDRQKQATFRIAERVRNVGRLPSESEHTVAFPVWNTGSRRLVINEIDTECGCGERVRRTLLIPLGETADIEMTLHTHFVSGPIEQVTSFTTNVPDESRFQLAVRGFVEPAQNRNPKEFDEHQVSVLIRESSYLNVPSCLVR